jgi:hypothetical protein
MTGIAKIDFPNALDMDAQATHPSVLLWTHPQRGLLQRIQDAMQQRKAHPARTLVLLPYAHLLPLAGRLWAQCFPDGFAPQFETTQNWRTRMGGFAPGATDITFDMALDTLTASALLRTAGLGAQQDALAGLLVQAAHQLGPLAAACHPDERARWAHTARLAATVGMESPALAMEVAVRIAVSGARPPMPVTCCLVRMFRLAGLSAGGQALPPIHWLRFAGKLGERMAICRWPPRSRANKKPASPGTPATTPRTKPSAPPPAPLRTSPPGVTPWHWCRRTGR